jgi:uncharacterized membrane protein/nitrite reductase/ring-hydroxylating ferredoxin subunit
MRSRAHIRTHPLHPILVGFPISFFTAALSFDILGVVRDDASWHTQACRLLIAGIGMAVLSAIAGVMDFIYTVPPASSAKKRASTHAFLNLCMLALFTTALIYRLTHYHPEPMVYILLEAGAFVIMLSAGWMGGTLVHRNQIGVDPRYAFAGKWRELHAREEDGKLNLGVIGDLKRDQMILVHAPGKRIVLARTEQRFVAFDDRCTHKGGSLAGGSMICGTVQCPWHGSQFDVSSGAVKAGPASETITTYTVELQNDVVYIHLDRSSD